MLYEYAVEPKAIGTSWESFKYLIEKFGFDRGRLISRFPKKWTQQVIETARQSGMAEVRFKSLVDKLDKAKTQVLVPSGRHYDSVAGDWLDNAIQQHTLEPFRAIIASENRGVKDFILVAEEIVEETPLMIAPTEQEVGQIGKLLAEAMSPFLKYSKKILFVDPYFDLRESRYKETLQASLEIIAAAGSNGVQCELHFRDFDDTPSTQFIASSVASWLKGKLPEGLTVRLFSWKRKKPGVKFHARFLLTERGGILVDEGFSSDDSDNKVLLKLLGFKYCQDKLATFERSSQVYELIEPISEILSDGSVREI